MTLSRDKKNIFFRAKNAIWSLNLTSPPPYKPKKIAKFDDKSDPVIDMCMDKKSNTFFGLNKKGEIMSVVLNRGLKDCLNWKYSTESRWKKLGKKEPGKRYTAIAVSRNGLYLVSTSSYTMQQAVIRNDIYVYRLNKGKEKPIVLTKRKILTGWQGGKHQTY